MATLNDKFTALGNSIINLTDRKVGAYNTEVEDAILEVKDMIDEITEGGGTFWGGRCSKYEQGYEYLKTLDEFKDAEDC